MERQKPLKSARFATKMLPKCVLPICYQTDLGRGLTAGDQPFFDSLIVPAELRSDSAAHLWSFSMLASINVVVVPSQELSRWPSITKLRQSHILAVEGVIFLSIVEFFPDP